MELDFILGCGVINFRFGWFILTSETVNAGN
jgi:hypothetical protein